MKKVRINKLVLSGFMGCREFAFVPDGRSAVISGANRTGKTTLANAFCWLLSGKDSHGNSVKNFDLKPVCADGNVEPCEECSVVAEIRIDEDKPLTFKRVYIEKRNKKRILTGHTTKFFVDDLEIANKEYDKVIDCIIPKDKLELLVNVGTFHCMAWEKRRTLLSEMCGISGNELLEVEREKKKLTDKKKVIEKAYGEIPVNIKEAKRHLVEVRDRKTAESLVAELRVKISAGEDDVSLSIKRDLNTLELQILSLTETCAQDLIKHRIAMSEKISNLEIKHTDTENALAQIDRSLRNLDSEDVVLTEKIREQRLLFKKENKTEASIADICLCCGQNLPEAKIKAMVSEYNLCKSKKLNMIKIDGTLSVDTLKKNGEIRERLIKDHDILTKENDVTSKNLIKIRDSLSVAPITSKIGIEINELENRKARLSLTIKPDTGENTDDLKEKIRVLDTELAQIQLNDKILLRIEELKTKEKSLFTDIESIEGDVGSAEDTLQRIAGDVEVQVNSKFDHMNFKLFSTCLNGTIKPCCETTVNGVGYDRGLNTGNRIQCDLELALKFADFYGLSVPVFIDHAEAVTDDIDVEAQVFKLFADKYHDSLHIEYLS